MKAWLSSLALSVAVLLTGCVSSSWTDRTQSTQAEVDSGDYLQRDGSECPPDFKLSLGDDREIAEWAMGEIYDSSKSEGWWCLINDDLVVHARSNDFRVWVSTQWDAQQANSIELARNICVAFVSPFRESGIDVFINGHLLEGEQRLDGSAETEVDEHARLADGATYASDEAGKCQSYVYFKSTADRLVSKGWSESDGELDELTFRAKLSDREDFYSR